MLQHEVDQLAELPLRPRPRPLLGPHAGSRAAWLEGAVQPQLEIDIARWTGTGAAPRTCGLLQAVSNIWTWCEEGNTVSSVWTLHCGKRYMDMERLTGRVAPPAGPARQSHLTLSLILLLLCGPRDTEPGVG